MPSGVYRVVGTGSPVVLLRVGTEAGRRVHTGEIHAVDAATLTEAFEPAANPDDGFDPVAVLRNAAQGLYWQFRRFV